MKTLQFNIHIQASPQKIWQVLWNDTTYRKWTAVFHEGSYAVSEWKEGSTIQFLSPDGSGMYSVIEKMTPYEYMVFKHIGEIKKFEKQPIDEKIKQWSGAVETYTLTKEKEGTTLLVKVDTLENFSDYFNGTFPKALEKIKELSENPIMITVESTVPAAIEKVWNCFTNPQDIMSWNNASPDWHTPKASNDLKVGGKFSYTMAAKDGSFSFDFLGTYTAVKNHELIEYTLGDNRNVSVAFLKTDGGVKLVETFEAETENTLDLQRFGWQAILDNFKKHVENN